MKPENGEILIIVEHVARELDVACLIKYYLEQKGCLVSIVSLPYYKNFQINKKNIRIVAVPFFYSIEYYNSIISDFKDITVLNLAYEQIFQNVNENLKAPKDQYAKQSVIHHSWSKNYFNYLTKYGVFKNNIIINGNLSYSLYKKPYREYFFSRYELAEKYGLNPHKKWFFLPENYAAAFYSDFVIKDKIKNGIDPEEINLYKGFATQSLKKVIQWISRYLQSNDVEIIFRPRPAVSLDRLEQFFYDTISELPEGLKIIKEKTVREWILASDMVISSYSTTLIEAAIAEKPIAMIAPIPFPPYLYAGWYDMVPQITNYYEFSNILSNINPDSYAQLKNWAEVEMMSKGDPINGIANIFLQLKKNGFSFPRINPKKNLEINLKYPVRRLLKGIRDMKNRLNNPQQEVFELYEDDYFTDNEVKMRVEHWSKVLTK